MTLYTDNPGYGRAVLPPSVAGALAPCPAVPEPERAVVEDLLGPGAPVYAATLQQPGWQHVVATDFAAGSQYDRLINLARAAALPDRVACVARTGSGFHGFKVRPWRPAPGNIHLAVHLAPGRPIERFEAAFTALAAVAVAEAVDEVPGLAGTARIKWVNDVLLGEAKVGGVLAYTQTIGDVVSSVVLGIGLNVESAPAVPRSPHVPAVGSLRGAGPNPGVVETAQVLHSLLHRLAALYDRLLDAGPGPILEAYRARSMVLGREVLVTDDGEDTATPRIVAGGRVSAIGDGLELVLEGRPDPVTRGRLVLAASSIPAALVPAGPGPGAP
jgi:BirA family transcriptional regulator, biotin operon repressor / biotin---[acetyl-CoA-carboxylase] ligase